MRNGLTASALAGALAAAIPGVSAAGTVWEWDFTTSAGCGGSTGITCPAGTAWGNQRKWNGIGAGAPAVTGSAWSNTSGATGGAAAGSPSDGKIEPAFLAYFSNNFVGVQNQDGSALDATEPGDPEHSLDNNQRYDSILFNFGQKVKLTDVGIGWTNPATNGPNASTNDVDLTVFAYLGSGAPAFTNYTVTPKSYAELTGPDWQKVSYNFDGTGYKPVNTALTETQYWLISTYVPNGGPAGVDAGDDYAKIKGLKATPGNNVPEPGTLMLLGVAALGFLSSRRAGGR